MWMTYGLLKPDAVVTYVNSIGLFLQLSYILVYHTYTESKVSILVDLYQYISQLKVSILVSIL